MTQLSLFPWSGYGWITVKGRRLYALVYHTWDRWFALPAWNPGLKRELIGDVARIEAFGELVEPLTVRNVE